MIENLEIRNFALIESLSIDLHPGFNVITGETGSGKSIILGALNLLLGEKADALSLRSGAPSLSVSAVFSIPEGHEILSWLADRGIEVDPDEREVVVRRIVKENGRSQIRIHDILCTREELRFFSDSLIDMHGQGEHQSLLSQENQRKILDSYAENAELIARTRLLAGKVASIRTEIENTREKSAEAQRNRDYLEFALTEIEKAAINDPLEDEDLKSKISRAGQVRNIYEDVNFTVEFLKNSRRELYNASSALGKAVKIDSALDSFVERLSSALIETEDISESLQEYLGSVTFSEAELDEMQARLATLQKMKRKYGSTLASVLEFAGKAREDLSLADGLDERLHDLEVSLAAAVAEYTDAARALTDSRSAAAATLQKDIERTLRELGMPSAVFRIDIQTDAERIQANGRDSVSFLFCANPGEDMKSLKNASSGGELSRIMLAIKTVLSASDSIQTQVFDEIDTGIGGSVAHSLASCIRRLAEKKQVLCVTHLASLAAAADSQFVVSKEVREGRTYTTVREVSGDERVAEIARMLSGDESAETVAHARKMLSDKV